MPIVRISQRVDVWMHVEAETKAEAKRVVEGLGIDFKFTGEKAAQLIEKHDIRLEYSPTTRCHSTKPYPPNIRSISCATEGCREWEYFRNSGLCWTCSRKDPEGEANVILSRMSGHRRRSVETISASGETNTQKTEGEGQ